MKRHNSLISLSHDHHHGLILAQLIKKNAPKYKNLPNTIDGKVEYTIYFYNTELVKHFRQEEEILFPPSKGKDESLDILIGEIITEHKKIRILVEALKTKNHFEEILDELGNLLESHIRKEERKLFPEIEKVIAEDEMMKISNAMALFDSN
jgi:iron-sulfur cluster repair protein YtfE (RIC family)